MIILLNDQHIYRSLNCSEMTFYCTYNIHNYAFERSTYKPLNCPEMFLPKKCCLLTAKICVRVVHGCLWLIGRKTPNYLLHTALKSLWTVQWAANSACRRRVVRVDGFCFAPVFRTPELGNQRALGRLSIWLNYFAVTPNDALIWKKSAWILCREFDERV